MVCEKSYTHFFVKKVFILIKSIKCAKIYHEAEGHLKYYLKQNFVQTFAIGFLFHEWNEIPKEIKLSL